MTTPVVDPATNQPIDPAAPAAVDTNTNPAPANSDPAPADPPAPITLDVPADPPATDADTQFAYGETGDPALDVALDFIGKLGIGPQDPAVVAATNGKFELLEAKLEVLGDKAKGYERIVALAKGAYERSQEAAKATTTAIQSAVTKVATDGGVEWAAVQKWASANADPAEKQAINAMLTADAVQARAAASLLVDAYRQSGGATITPANAVNTNAAPANTTVTNGALSPRDYAREVEKLSAQIGPWRLDSSPEYAALKARAAAYRA